MAAARVARHLAGCEACRAELAAIHAQLGYKLGVDVGQGMGTPSIKRWAQLLGMSFESRGPPRGDAQWSALLRGKGEVMLSLRMFHEKFRHGKVFFG